MKNLILVFIISSLVLIISSNAEAQSMYCGNKSNLQNLDIERKINKYINNNRQKPIEDMITIPVVLHIIHNNEEENVSEKQVRMQLLSLNNAYNNASSNSNIPEEFKNLIGNMDIQFCLSFRRSIRTAYKWYCTS